MHALVIGGTGLVGVELLRLLASDTEFSRIDSVGRSIVPDLQDRVHQVVMDLLEESLPANVTPDVVFCCLGTTIRTAGSQEAFRRVDYEMPMRIAKAARARGAQHFILVSSLGANLASRTFYSRIKGELERELQTLGYPSLTFVRPPLLLGDRTEPRFGEQVATLVMLTFRLLIPRSLRAISATRVAAAMVAAAKRRRVGVEVIENRVL